MKLKVSDYVAQFLKAKGIQYVFGLQGGAVVHLFDSIDKTDGIKAIFCHHEQCAALAAVSYSRVSENIGAVIVTTGPGSTNALTGLLAAWQDSIPCLFISGQTRKEHTSYGRKVRQVGTQEFNIVDVVRPMTKYAKFISEAPAIEEELDRAYEISMAGRPGPAWLDIPVNLQWTTFEPIGGRQSRRKIDVGETPNFARLAEMLRTARQPIVIAGHGVRSGKAVGKFRNFISRTKLPFVTTWTASDLLPTAHPLNVGIIGLCGQRGANKAVHEADLLLVLGSHLSIPQTSTLFDQFAPRAKKIVVNIDKDQLEDLNIKIDLPIAADVNDMFDWANARSLDFVLDSEWLTRCASFKEMNSVASGLKGQRNPSVAPGVNSYVFNDLMTRALPSKACIVVDGGGTALYTGFQSSYIKGDQRIVCSSTMSAMGTGLAESIGACLASERALTTCIIGDGSFLMNVQDLQTIYHQRLPVKIFVMDNGGYLAIRHTQATFLEGRFAGSSPQGGLTFPSTEKIAAAFQIPYFCVASESESRNIIDQVLSTDGPVVCEVLVPQDQEMLFKQGYKRNEDGTFSPMALAEMWPFNDL